MKWKQIIGSPHHVSDKGHVKSIKMKNAYLKPSMHRKGYLLVVILVNGRRKTAKIHRLVAEAFIPNPNNYPQVNHIDCNRTNNSVDNLEWCDNSINQLHRFANVTGPDFRTNRKIAKSGYRGVYVDKSISDNGKRFYAIFHQKKKNHRLGFFYTAEEANDAYQQFADSYVW